MRLLRLSWTPIYGRILDADGNRIDAGEWENALFILTSVMSHAKPDKAICDAGLKVQSGSTAGCRSSTGATT